MKTMFSMGFASQDFFGVQPAPYASMGQTTIDGNKMLADISAADDKLGVIGAWVNNRPDYQTILGAYLPAWNNAQAQVEANYGTVIDVQMRLSSTDPSVWSIKSWEQQAVQDFISAVNQQYQIISSMPVAKPTAAAKAPVKVPVPPPSTAPSPLLIGAGAVAAVGLLALVVNR